VANERLGGDGRNGGRAQWDTMARSKRNLQHFIHGLEQMNR